MNKSRSPNSGYILAAVLGATAGGFAVAILCKAIPTMMSRMMANMMQQMGDEGCNPEDM